MAAHSSGRGCTGALHTKGSNYTISARFHLVPVIEWGCLSPRLVGSRLVNSKARFNHLLNVEYHVLELGRNRQRHSKRPRNITISSSSQDPERSQEVVIVKTQGCQGPRFKSISHLADHLVTWKSCEKYKLPGLQQPIEAVSLNEDPGLVFITLLGRFWWHQHDTGLRIDF